MDTETGGTPSSGEEGKMKGRLDSQTAMETTHHHSEAKSVNRALYPSPGVAFRPCKQREIDVCFVWEEKDTGDQTASSEKLDLGFLPKIMQGTSIPKLKVLCFKLTAITSVHWIRRTLSP